MKWNVSVTIYFKKGKDDKVQRTSFMSVIGYGNTMNEAKADAVTNMPLPSGVDYVVATGAYPVKQ